MVLQNENEAKATSVVIIFWGACIFQTAGSDIMKHNKHEYVQTEASVYG